MKTVVLSDTHLSSTFHPKKFEYLKNIIEDADRVVIAGDFWDGFSISFNNFVESKWQKLFPYLLEKNAVYLYGNHDREEWCDERVSLFSVEQGMETVIGVNGREYHIAHGHTIFEPFEIWPEVNSKLILRVASYINVLRRMFWAESLPKEGSAINTPMIQWATSNLSEDQILICGHSHYPQIDIAKKFINSGFIGLGYASHVLIDADSPKIVTQRY